MLTRLHYTILISLQEVSLKKIERPFHYEATEKEHKEANLRKLVSLLDLRSMTNPRCTKSVNVSQRHFPNK